MSYQLRIWEHPATERAPADLAEAGQLMLRLERLQPGVNPKFVALGRKMAQRYPAFASDRKATSDDAVWLSDPAGEAEHWADAVWPVAIPTLDRVKVIRHAIEDAVELGLTVFDDQLGMAFMPSGEVFPADKAVLWECMRHEMDAMPIALSKSDLRKMMATFIRDVVAKHGFVARESALSDLEFVRPTPAGLQTIEMWLEGSAPRLKCRIHCRQRHEPAEQVFEKLFDTDTPNTFVFNVGVFTGQSYDALPINEREQIRSLMERLSKALPVMDLARTPQGLNKVMNCNPLFSLKDPNARPGRPNTLASYFHNESRRLSFKALIVAWLVDAPDFESLESNCRKFVARRVDVSEADLDRVLQYLIEHVKRNADPVLE